MLEMQYRMSMEPINSYETEQEILTKMTTLSTGISAEILIIKGAKNNSRFNYVIEIRHKFGNLQLYQEHTQILTERMQSKRNTGKSFQNWL